MREEPPSQKNWQKQKKQQPPTPYPAEFRVVQHGPDGGALTIPIWVTAHQNGLTAKPSDRRQQRGERGIECNALHKRRHVGVASTITLFPRPRVVGNK